MPNRKMCCECNTKSDEFPNGCSCLSCGTWFCIKCRRGYESHDVVTESFDARSNTECEVSIKFCKFCDVVNSKREAVKKNCEKVHPSESPPRDSLEPSSAFGGESIQSGRLVHHLESGDPVYSSHAASSRCIASFSAHPYPVCVRDSPSRSDEEEAEYSGKPFYSPSSEYFHDISDLDSSSISSRVEFCDCNSVGSSPLHRPYRNNLTFYRPGQPVQQEQHGSPLSHNYDPFDQENMAVLRMPEKETGYSENNCEYSDDISILHNQLDEQQKSLDFESNGRIWYPPPPEDENDEAESDPFPYDDDDDYFGDSSTMFTSSSSFSDVFPSKEKHNDGNKECLRAVIQVHFRALVSQLLQGEGVRICEDVRVINEGNTDDWLGIVTSLAWQAANFVKPDTSRGGSMDPVDYVKVKCIAAGSPSDSVLVKGVVCTKNIKHKRMTAQYKNPRLLLLGGALEYQNVVNQLASFNTLVQQESDHLKMIMSKIEALRPNVLLVEKSVSPYAQEYLLTKEISLVPNVKSSLLERIARCTGAHISASIDSISTTRLGHCELFQVERICEEHENTNQLNKKPSKTLMFFEGCPRRLGCTIMLRGSCREELKKVKHVVQFAVFAAYHLSLETSFLADEGASLPKMKLKSSISEPESTTADNSVSLTFPTDSCSEAKISTCDDGYIGLEPEHTKPLLLSRKLEVCSNPLSHGLVDRCLENAHFDACHDKFTSNVGNDSFGEFEIPNVYKTSAVSKNLVHSELYDSLNQEQGKHVSSCEFTRPERFDDGEGSSEYFSATETHQSILVSFSSRYVPKGTVCERSRLLRIKFYGSFDKPLGRYLRDDLFDQTSYCRFCKEPAEAHVLCYTHQQGNLTINVRSLASATPPLPGERDGKIWMWHRCLRCNHVDGVPPATRRVVMSDAAWGLSFGKFLELSFSNHATANRLAPCGHSLQRDCLRFYGFGSMVAFFRYSPIDILNVHLPPSVLEFNGQGQQKWIREEAVELLVKVETFYSEISAILDNLEQESKSFDSELPDANQLQNHLMNLKDQLRKERSDYHSMLQHAVGECPPSDQAAVDILELNRLRQALLIGSYDWNRQLYLLDSLLKTKFTVKVKQGDASPAELQRLRSDIFCKDGQLEPCQENDVSGYYKPQVCIGNHLTSEQIETSMSLESFVPEDSICEDRAGEVHSDGELNSNKNSCSSLPPSASNLSERMDSAWTGTEQFAADIAPLFASQADGSSPSLVNQTSLSDYSPFKRTMAPNRVNSFDSALRIRERIHRGLLPSSLNLAKARSFHASGDYRSMVRDRTSIIMQTFSQKLPIEAQKLNLEPGATPSFISASHMAGGARLLLPQRGCNDIVIGVYDDDPASVVSYALSSKEYEDWVTDKSNENEGIWGGSERCKEDSTSSNFSSWQSFGAVNSDYIHYGSYGSEDLSSSAGTLFMDSKRSPHLTVSFGDDSSLAGGKVKFSVTCYFAKQFDSLRKKCCPSDVDFVRSLSRCQRWSAQGGKSNVYFARSLDERFIIKQVKKTELESFEEFAPEFFKYLTDSLNSGSPTCLAKVLGIYQVSVKHLKGGKETKMDLMVMENLFYKRSITRIYDLKGSARSRYNPDTTGSNKVLLDLNLVEELCTEPIFLGSKAKRSLERAIWNDTSFLTSVDVMDYSLLVGVDEERKELVLGIIDFMRQYTWDKHLETWVKASGILGGPRNASPTIISPKQYKKRFRKAMTSYFLTVPDQWSS
ncbi:hypothetical protein K2173_001466 [Erythroxylum novogranatense]|uniref:1-phosphatidylinositol-3-phosphate 5-kinase n=1 Tax=Erythroxylum novogranatense TaxID=1862640 RepID=A0AAV8TTK2_9ROSI|nr:hypothetical protein K2173_001466 [Erythroxylum novogranatense]